VKRLESARAAEARDRPLKGEFACLKLLPREYSGPRRRVKVGKRPDGRDEYEERPGPPAPNQVEDQGTNVLRLYLVGAPESGNEVDCSTIASRPLAESAPPRRGV
jgi:hypothetical protein